MNANGKHFRFKLGRFDCMVVSDGACLAPASPFKQTSPQDNATPRTIKINIQCLLIKTEKHTVLIDTGWGAGNEPGAGELIQNLSTAGIRCEDIDTIIFSHGHPDHIGGSTDASGRPVFRNARYRMYRKEWEYWISNPELPDLDETIKQTTLAGARKNLKPIKECFDLFDEGTEIIPGIGFMTTPGHSPGHIAPVISSGKEQLFCTGDLFHHPSDLTALDWSLVAGRVNDEGMNSRIKVLSEAVKTNALVFASHFTFPGVGHIGKKGGTWFWQPLETA